MRHILKLLPACLGLASLACTGEISTPPSQGRFEAVVAQKGSMRLTELEETLFDELTRNMDGEKATRLRARLVQPGVRIASSDPKEQALINALYSSLRARANSARTRIVPTGPPPRTAENSWTPKGDDLILLNAILNRYAPQYRAAMREDLLRKDILLTAKADDPESQKLLDQFYERRQRRIDETGPNW